MTGRPTKTINEHEGNYDLGSLLRPHYCPFHRGELRARARQQNCGVVRHLNLPLNVLRHNDEASFIYRASLMAVV